MNSQLLRSGRSLVVIGLASVLLGGCVKPNAPGVAIEPLNADIVFGVEEIANREADPAAIAPDPAGIEAELDNDLLPEQVFAPPAPRNFPRPPLRAVEAAPKVECPDALLNAFPAETAPLEVPDDRSPKEGLYKWKRDATVERATQFGPVATNQKGLEERLVRNFEMVLEDPSDGGRTYRYEVVQPELGTSNVAIMTYQVDTNATAVQAFNPVGADDPPRVGEVERGVVLKSVRYEDEAGNRLPGAFTPATGLLILPLGVLVGEVFTSTAVDPSTQQTWRLEAVVESRDRVDACGEIIEGYRVKGDLTVTGANGGTRKATWIVAPHLGGMVIGEQFEGEYGDLKVTYNANIGQLEPSPAPVEEGA